MPARPFVFPFHDELKCHIVNISSITHFQVLQAIVIHNALQFKCHYFYHIKNHRLPPTAPRQNPCPQNVIAVTSFAARPAFPAPQPRSLASLLASVSAPPGGQATPPRRRKTRRRGRSLGIVPRSLAPLVASWPPGGRLALVFLPLPLFAGISARALFDLYIYNRSFAALYSLFQASAIGDTSFISLFFHTLKLFTSLPRFCSVILPLLFFLTRPKQKAYSQGSKLLAESCRKKLNSLR